MRNYVIFLIITLMLASCRTKETKKEESRLVKGDVISDKRKENDILKVMLYDTDFIKNKFGYGKLKYTLLQANNVNKRFVAIVISGNNEAHDFESVLNTADDALYDSVSNHEVEFEFKVKFSEIGNQELKIAVKEFIELKGNKISSEVLEGKNVYEIPVFVIDSSSIIGYKGDTAYYVGERMVKIKRKDSAKLVRKNQRKLDSMKRVLNNQ